MCAILFRFPLLGSLCRNNQYDGTNQRSDFHPCPSFEHATEEKSEVAIDPNFRSDYAQLVVFVFGVWHFLVGVCVLCNTFLRTQISEEHKDKFRFDHFVVVAPCESAGGGPPAVSGPAMLSDFYFSRFDDEVLLQVSVVCAVAVASSAEVVCTSVLCRKVDKCLNAALIGPLPLTLRWYVCIETSPVLLHSLRYILLLSVDVACHWHGLFRASVAEQCCPALKFRCRLCYAHSR